MGALSVRTALTPPAVPGRHHTLARRASGCHDVDVAYFTAVLARSASGWRARDVEVDGVQTLEDLADALRGASVDDHPVLALVEREDAWFALIRVDGEEDPRVFVSDLLAASHSRFADLLAPAADVDPGADMVVPEMEDPGDEDSGDEDSGDEPSTSRSEVARESVAPWAGEVDLLDDLGMSGALLRDLVDDSGDDPGRVLAEVGDAVGFGELLEVLR